MTAEAAAAGGGGGDVDGPDNITSTTANINVNGEGKRVGEKGNDVEEKSAKKGKKPNGSSNNNKNNSKKETKKRKKEVTVKGNKNKKGSSSSSSSPPTASSCSFPMSRVRRLVRGEAGNATDCRITNDAIFLINKASEMFLQCFAQDAFSNAVRARRRSIGYHHLSSTVSKGKRYEFLSDFVPEQIKAEDALKARALVESGSFYDQT